MKYRLLIYLTVTLVGFSFLSCDSDETRPEFSLEQSDQITDEEYSIYSLVINEKYSSNSIVIQQSTTTNIFLKYDCNAYDYLIQTHKHFDTRLVKIHENLNESSVNFGEHFYSDTKEISLISNEELSFIFNSNNLNSDWEEFYNEFKNSNGIIRFSRVAINDNRTQAIFEIGHSYASLGGNGSIIYLEKLDNIWTIKEVIPSWVS